MKVLPTFLVAGLLISGPAIAQGLQQASPVDDNTVVIVCQPNCQPGKPIKDLMTTAPSLAQYIISKVAPSAASLNVLIIQGNASGTYAVPAIVAANKLLVGFSSDDDLAAAAYNWSPSNFVLVSNLINTAHGWKTAAGQVLDPTATDWTNHSLIWLYQ